MMNAMSINTAYACDDQYWDTNDMMLASSSVRERHLTVGVALLKSNASNQLTSSNEELPVAVFFSAIIV